jgi:predicted HTH transcriptional regulator
MRIDQSQVDELVTRPSEGLNVEVKTWIDPDVPDGMAKIIRAALALRNRNGGYLLIGFDDKSLQHGVIPGSCHTKAQGISSPGTHEAISMWPCNDGEQQWNATWDWTCR